MNLASPKLGGKQNAFVLLPSGHGGSRTLLSSLYLEGYPICMSRDSFPDYRLAESCQERTDALVLVLTQLFHRLRSMTVIWRVRLLLALVKGIFCPLSERPSLLGELFQLVTIVRAKLSPGQTLLDSGFSLLRRPCVKHGYHPF